MNPTKKSDGIENALANMFGFNRAECIKANRCVPAPIGCGQTVLPTDFRDELSLKEYRISGMCQQCQDKFFGA